MVTSTIARQSNTRLLRFGNWIPFTSSGKWAIVLVAVVVAIFAGLQYYGAWRARQ